MEKSFTITLDLQDLRDMSNNPNLNPTQEEFDTIINNVELEIEELELRDIVANNVERMLKDRSL